jgi:hypothetical protein
MLDLRHTQLPTRSPHGGPAPPRLPAHPHWAGVLLHRSEVVGGGGARTTAGMRAEWRRKGVRGSLWPQTPQTTQGKNATRNTHLDRNGVRHLLPVHIPFGAVPGGSYHLARFRAEAGTSTGGGLGCSCGPPPEGRHDPHGRGSGEGSERVGQGPDRVWPGGKRPRCRGVSGSRRQRTSGAS